MSGRKKIALGTAGAFGLLAVLLIALALLMPRWINGEAVKAGILARASRAAGFEIDRFRAVKAEGDLDDPRVSLLPPSAVVKGLLGVVERTLKLPVRIFEGGVP
jgi:hypothetical protein